MELTMILALAALAVVIAMILASVIWMARDALASRLRALYAQLQNLFARFRAPPTPRGGWIIAVVATAFTAVVIVATGIWSLVIGAFLLGFAAVAFLFSPLYAFRSAEAFDKSNGKEEWFVIFVRRRPNRLMQRIRGTGRSGRPLDFIGIVPPGRNFYGETQAGRSEGLTKDYPKYWELVEDASGARAPTGVEINRSWIIRLWMWYVNLFSDVVLVGVRKLYGIYTYPIEKIRYHKKTGSGGSDEYDIEPPNLDEVSNHVRITPFQWAVAILQAETHDRVSWTLLLVANLKSKNPWLTLHNHENWSQFVTSALVDSAMRGLRNLDIEDIVGLAETDDLSDEARDKIIEPVYHIEPRLLQVVGLEFDRTVDLKAAGYSGGVQIVSIKVSLDTDEDRKAFRQPWRAEQEARAEVTLGKAEAKREGMVIDAVAKKVEKYGDAGMLVQRMQALENSAKTGKSTLVFDSGSQTSNAEKLLALLVAEREREARERRGE